MDPKIYARAQKCAYRILALRSRSEYEVRAHLEKRGFDHNVQEAVITALTDAHLIDDKKFAHEWLDEKMRRTPKAPDLLAHELCNKGVDRSIVNEVMRDRADVQDEYATARALADQRWPSVKTLPQVKAYNRLAGFLARRGFSTTVIEDVLVDFFDADTHGF